MFFCCDSEKEGWSDGGMEGWRRGRSDAHVANAIVSWWKIPLRSLHTRIKWFYLFRNGLTGLIRYLPPKPLTSIFLGGRTQWFGPQVQPQPRGSGWKMLADMLFIFLQYTLRCEIYSIWLFEVEVLRKRLWKVKTKPKRSFRTLTEHFVET